MDYKQEIDIKRWFARIAVDNKEIHLGSFKSKGDAIKARKDAEIMYGFHENHGAPKIEKEGKV